MMAHGRLAHVDVIADGPDVLLALSEHRDYLKPGRVTDLLQEHRRLLGQLEPLFGPLLRVERLACHGRRISRRRCHCGYSEFESPARGSNAASFALGW
jgi:hypothetical protein